MLVPLATSARGEQAHNARQLADDGAALMLDGVGVPTADALQAALDRLLRDPDLRGGLAARARSHDRPDAAEHLADLVLTAAH